MGFDLQQTLGWLREVIAPQAEAIDRDPQALGAALDALAERGLLALRRPQSHGGPAVADDDYARFQEGVARASGAACRAAAKSSGTAGSGSCSAAAISNSASLPTSLPDDSSCSRAMRSQ